MYEVAYHYLQLFLMAMAPIIVGLVVKLLSKSIATSGAQATNEQMTTVSTIASAAIRFAAQIASNATAAPGAKEKTGPEKKDIAMDFVKKFVEAHGLPAATVGLVADMIEVHLGNFQLLSEKGIDIPPTS